MVNIEYWIGIGSIVSASSRSTPNGIEQVKWSPIFDYWMIGINTLAVVNSSSCVRLLCVLLVTILIDFGA